MLEITPFPKSLSRNNALGIIRAAVADSTRIGWSEHARVRMSERGITMRQALETLRSGKIVKGKGPTQDEYGDWKVTLSKRSAGRNIRVAVAIREASKDITVVTVI